MEAVEGIRIVKMEGSHIKRRPGWKGSAFPPHGMKMGCDMN